MLKYNPPPGFVDFPFTYMFSGDGLVDGMNAPKQFVPIEGGLGDFILRRVVGVDNIVSPSNGQFQLYDDVLEYVQSAPIFVQGGGEFAVVPEERYRELGAIRFDLYNVARSLSDPVTAPPVLIDKANGVFHQDSGNLQGVNFAGSSGATNLYSLGGALYAILWEAIITSHARCFKSVDNGLTWIAQDIAHEPGFDGNFVNEDPRIFYPGTGTKLYVVWDIHISTGGGLHNFFLLNTFDTANGLWGTQSPQGPIDVVSQFYVQNCVLPSGDQYVFFTGSSNNIVYLKFSGGVWAGPTTVTAIAANIVGKPKTLIVDATGRMHLFYQEVNGVTNLANFFYVQISAAGVVGAPVQIFTGTVAFKVFNTGAGVIWNGQLVVPYQNTNDNITSVILGSPLSAPVFTTLVVDAGAGSVPAGGAALMPSAMIDGGGTLQIFWGTNSVGDLDDRIWQNSNPGSGFGVSQTFYKDATDPPPGETTPGIIQISSPVQTPSGAFGMLWDSTLTTGIPSFFLGGSSLLAAQMAFQGVRRVSLKKGLLEAAHVAEEGSFKPKSFAYNPELIINVLGAVAGAPAAFQSLIQKVSDYDFELYELKITYVGATGPISGSKPLTKIWLYDMNKQQLSNLPVLDVFYNGAPGSKYKNGAIVPPLLYERESTIRLDVFSLIANSSFLPVTMTVHLIGRQRFPC